MDAQLCDPELVSNVADLSRLSFVRSSVFSPATRVYLYQTDHT